ncbi:MAG: hypothetical protein EOO62_25500, partial [Hymenobacter sp.]
MSFKFKPADVFETRHNAPTSADQQAMLRAIGVESVEQLIAETVPAAIRLPEALALPPALSERQFLKRFK